MSNPNKTYGLSNPLQDTNPLTIKANRAPAAGDRQPVGTIWVDQPTNQVYMMTSAAAGVSNYTILGPGASDIDTMTGDGGGAISPTLGDMILAGGTNITTAGTAGPGTITLNMDAAITLATSVTSPLFTAAADALIVAGGVNDVVVRLGDNAGATFFRVQDSDSADVYTVDSDGAHTAFAGLVVTGAFTQTAGVANIGADAAANAVNIGTGAAAKVVTMGSVTGAASLDLLAGTGNFSLEGNVATTYAISNVGVNTGQVDIAGGTGARAINIGGGGTGAKTIGIGAAASADVITIGDATGAGSLALVCGTGNFTLDGVGASTYGIGVSTTGGTIVIGGTSQTGTITLGDSDGINIVEMGSGEGATTVNIAGGATAINAVNIATGAVANTVNVGSANAGAIAIDTAAGFSIDGATASNVTVTGAGVDLSLQGVGGAVNVTSTQTENDAVYIEASAANGGVEINAGTGGVRIGDEADCTGLTFGNIAPTANRNITIGSGTVVTAAVTDDISIGDGGATTNVNSIKHVDINNGGVTLGEVNTYIASGAVTSGTHLTEICTGNVTAGTATLDIATGTGVQTVQIATGAGAKALTLGSTNGASATVIQAGTGEITMTGTVKQIDAEIMGTTGVYIPTINMSPVMTTAATTGGVPTGATGAVNLMSLQNQVIMSQFILGAGQTIIAPRMSANGLLISLDLIVTEGAEYGFEGALDSTFGLTVGTSGAFFFELDLYINDMDGADPYIFGFRKTEANNAVFANYTDYYGLGMSAATSATECVIFDELNSTGQTITNTTDVWGGDGTTNTLRVDVSAAGVCTSYINGVIATAAPAFTFDADRVTPFIRLTHSATPTQVAITGMRIGLQA